MCVPPARLLLIKVSIRPFGPHFNPICIHFRGDDGTKIMIIYDLTIYNIRFFAEEREKIKEKGEKRVDIRYLSFQKLRVKRTRTLKISRRPMSMRSESRSLMPEGRKLHDMVGPISRPRVGPTLLKQLMAMVTALMGSMPRKAMMK